MSQKKIIEFGLKELPIIQRTGYNETNPITITIKCFKIDFTVDVRILNSPSE